MIFPAWVDHQEESFSYKVIQFKKFYLPLKTSYPPAKTLMKLLGTIIFFIFCAIIKMKSVQELSFLFTFVERFNLDPSYFILYIFFIFVDNNGYTAVTLDLLPVEFV